MTEFLYRYEARVDLFDTGMFGLELVEHPIHHRTPCGAWIWSGYKFVNLTKHKKFACETKEEALVSFIKRKERQVAILAAKHDEAVKALALAREAEAKCLAP